MAYWIEVAADYQVGDRVQDTQTHRHRGTVVSVTMIPMYEVQFDNHTKTVFPEWWSLQPEVKE